MPRCRSDSGLGRSGSAAWCRCRRLQSTIRRRCTCRRPHPFYVPPPVYAALAPAYIPPPLDPIIRWTQWSLNNLMGAGLDVDGIAGPATASAVAAFQARNGLVADGIVGSATIDAIRQQNLTLALPPAPQPPPPSA